MMAKSMSHTQAAAANLGIGDNHGIQCRNIAH